MYRMKNFYMKKVYDSKGKKIGIVTDLYIDFYNACIEGLKISKRSIFSKKDYVDVKDIISIGEEILVRKVVENKGLLLSDVIGMDVININGNIRGVLEDILIYEGDYSLRGVIVSTGVLDRLIHGKDILIPSRCILGDEYLIYKSGENVSLKTMPQRLD